MAALRDRVIAISGAASGIGLATSKHLYGLGARLSLTDIREDALQTAVKQITGKDNDPEKILIIVTDVRVSKEVDAWIEKTVSHFGALDGAANLAGVVGKHIGIHNITDLSDEEWGFVMDVNVTGVFYALRAQLRAMQKLGKGGSIVNAASTAGIEGNAKNASYSASKHGVVGLTRSAAKEVGGDKIRVNAIAPGVVDTPMVQTLPERMQPGVEMMLQNIQALHRKAQPEELAKSICFLLGDDSSFMTGAVVVVDGGEVC